MGKQGDALVHALSRATSRKEIENWCLFVAEIAPKTNQQQIWEAIEGALRRVLHDGFNALANPAARIAAEVLGVL
jgi:hypothetical protein